MSGTSRWARAAVEHIDARCSGEPLDRSLRITLNFHPDRVAGGVHILDALLRQHLIGASLLDRDAA